MKIVSAICIVVFLLCLLALPVIGYMGGRQCMPLSALLIPAEIVPLGVGFVAFILLVLTIVASLVTGRSRKWTAWALAIAITVTGLFWFCVEPGTFFLYGLRDRFVAQVGYPIMRQFAREVIENDSLTDADGTLYPPDRGAASPVTQKQWDDLVARYPFLGWNGGAVTVSRRGSVESYWGSALVGHWGFEVAPEGTLSVLEEDDGRALKVTDDIQFVSYYD